MFIIGDRKEKTEGRGIRGETYGRREIDRGEETEGKRQKGRDRGKLKNIIYLICICYKKTILFLQS
jgi:hypothetical protein